jgi:hypothetical protein
MLFLLGLFTRHSRTVSDRPLARLMDDPRGPEAVMSGLSDQDLAVLLNRLYQNLDTRYPDPSAGHWYGVAVGESYRRHSYGPAGG